MPEEEKETRSQRNKKGGRSNLVMNLSIGLLILAAVIILFESFFGGSNDNTDPSQFGQSSSEEETSFVIPPKDESESESNASSESESKESESSQESEESESESEEELELDEVPSNDANVLHAYVGDWDPIGTEQSEPHVIQYDEASVDWSEMKQASSDATGVSVDNMLINWIGNNGDQKVTVTFTEISTAKVFKVYLSWITNEGWQTTRYEELRQAP